MLFQRCITLYPYIPDPTKLCEDITGDFLSSYQKKTSANCLTVLLRVSDQKAVFSQLTLLHGSNCSSTATLKAQAFCGLA